MSPLEYLQWTYTTGHFKSRINLLSTILATGQLTTAPLDGQVAHIDGKHQVRDGNTWLPLQSKPVVTNGYVSPYLHFKDPITLPAGSFPNVHKDIETQIGNVIVNTLCVLYPFNDRIPFITGKVTAKKIESLILPLFVDEGKDGITPSMYNTYAKAVRLLMSVSGMIVPSATRKNTIAAPGIDELKKELKKKYDLSKPLDQTLYTAELSKYDEAWLKDDPTPGAVMSGKTWKARLKLYGAFGTELTFGPPGTTTSYIDHGLESGIPTDKKTFAELFSSARAASYSRGKLTAIGGVLAKLLARIVADITLVDGDCGTTKYLPYKLYNSSNMEGRYIMVNNKPALVTKEMLSQQTGGIVMMRTPGFCKSQGNSYCRVCAGEQLYALRSGVRLGAQEVAGGVLGLYLSMFHGLNRTSSKIDFDKICY